MKIIKKFIALLNPYEVPPWKKVPIVQHALLFYS